MNTKIRWTIGVVVGVATMSAPAAAQRVRLGFEARLSDRTAAAVSIDSRHGFGAEMHYRNSGPRSYRRAPARHARGYRARHQREVVRLIREHERLHRRMEWMRPRVAQRVHQAWHRRIVRHHGHNHVEWEHYRADRRRGGRDRGLRPVGSSY